MGLMVNKDNSFVLDFLNFGGGLNTGGINATLPEN